jgi:hypothetical protein
MPQCELQGWDEAHKAAAAKGSGDAEAASACLAEVCSRAQELGEHFYPNEVVPVHVY